MRRIAAMTSMRLMLVFSLLASSAALVSPTDTHAQASGIYSRAVLLAAHPNLSDPVYSQTVLLAAPGPNGWHYGVIINRPTGRRLASLFPGHGPSLRAKDVVHLGGPMAMHALIALVKRDSSPGIDALQISERLYLAIGANTVDRVIESSPNDARFFLGWVVWRPGELLEEIRAGYWSVHDADMRLVFRSNTKGLWQEMSRTRRGISTSIESDLKLVAR
jgi:putative AlgH/UPF0301 family transcriptional regulator